MGYDDGMEAMRAERCISISFSRLGLGSSLLPLLSRLMPRGACDDDDDEGALCIGSVSVATGV